MSGFCCKMWQCAVALALPLAATGVARGQTQVAPWGELRLTPTGLELHLADRDAPREPAIRIPRLNNPVSAVYVRGDEARKPLALSPGVKDWSIALPPPSDRSGALAIVVETVGPPQLAGEPRIVSAAADGVVTLAAHDAVTHGDALRYEPQQHKNTLGYWSRQEDWCGWHFTVARAGRYELSILQGCGRGQGGSEVGIIVGGQEIVFTVEETGHFQNFKRRLLGQVTLDKPGQYSLELRPRTKAAAAVMDVRQVRLTPLNPEP